MLRWAGSHLDVVFSPDGRFLVSSMQEAALHGWRLSDGKDMRMGGYPSKVRSLAFLGETWLATSGANGAVLWPFAGSNGPMGRQAMEIGRDDASLVTRVAGDERGGRLVAGLDDGRLWACDLASDRRVTLKAEKGPPIRALSVLPGARVAWGDEEGGAGPATGAGQGVDDHPGEAQHRDAIGWPDESGVAAGRQRLGEAGGAAIRRGQARAARRAREEARRRQTSARMRASHRAPNAVTKPAIASSSGAR